MASSFQKSFVFSAKIAPYKKHTKYAARISVGRGKVDRFHYTKEHMRMRNNATSVVARSSHAKIAARGIDTPCIEIQGVHSDT